MRFSVVHNSLMGRLRIAVPGLYRSPRLRGRLEQVLGQVADIQSVQANELTGRVLVCYISTVTQAEMLNRLDDALLGLVPEIPAQPEVQRPVKEDAIPQHAAPTTFHRNPIPVAGSDWHTLNLDELLDLLAADPDTGLSAREVRKRLKLHGPNAFGESAQRSELQILLEQFKSLPVAMLGVSAAIALMTGGRVDAAVIAGVVAINAVIGFYTERQAERTIASLGSMAPRNTFVIRGGDVRPAPVEKLVPGDVLDITPGCQIAADARLLSARRLSVDESALTGESLPVSKIPAASLALDTPLSNRRNMLYMGTLVTGGNARALVVQTGTRTELGRIQSLVDNTRPPETPMEKQLGQLSTELGILSGVVCLGIFGIGLLRGQPLLNMLTTAVSLAVAAVPEGLPAVATTTLAMGIRDMNRQQAAVRKVEAVETLGSVQVICLDKTGTLTMNHMTAVRIATTTQDMVIEQGRFMLDGEAQDASQDIGLAQLLKVIVLCSEAGYEQDSLTGSPTEVALLELAEANAIRITETRRELPRLEVRERAEGRPLMSTIHRCGEHEFIAVKGRPAELLARCTRKLENQRILALSDEERQAILHTNDRLAGKALRVLGFAYRTIHRGELRDAEQLIWVGMVGMQDPLRPGMPQLMRQFHAAGIKTVMITGDQSATAYAIGQELGLANGGAMEILDSTSLDKLDPALLAGMVRKVDVFSRVSPAHKLRIVQALQSAGLVVAMTGDGINDGPALKAADIGVAMGEGGSDIARSVADIVIKDDNLHTMNAAVRQGRTIYANIRKTIHYLLSTNFSEIEVMLASILAGQGSPLNPMQLLWINLVTDIFPGLALSFEPADADVMQRAPRPPDTPIITRQRLVTMAGESAFITSGALAAYLFGKSVGGPARGSTLAFHTLTSAQLLHALSSRSERYGLFNPDHRPANRWLNIALLATAAGQLATVTLPPLRRLLGTTLIRPVDLLVISAGAGLPLIINEAIKSQRNRRGDQATENLEPEADPLEESLS